MCFDTKLKNQNIAPKSSFRQNENPPDNKFEIGSILEAEDFRNALNNRCSIYSNNRQRSITFSLAKVVAKQGSRICLRHLGTDDRNDAWVVVDSDRIRPYPSGNELSIPFGFLYSHSSWSKFISRAVKEEKFALKEWFSMHPNGPVKNQFIIGEKLEAVDRRNSQLICPATISEIDGDYVLISFDGWAGTFDYWTIYNSQDLFPVGWCSESKHILQPPGPHYKNRRKSISECTEKGFFAEHTQNKIMLRQTIPIITKRKLTKTVENSIASSENQTDAGKVDFDSDCNIVQNTRGKRQRNNRLGKENKCVKVKKIGEVSGKSTKMTDIENTSRTSLSNGHRNISEYNPLEKFKPDTEKVSFPRISDKVLLNFKQKDILPADKPMQQSGCQNRKIKLAEEKELEKRSGSINGFVKVAEKEELQCQYNSCKTIEKHEFIEETIADPQIVNGLANASNNSYEILKNSQVNESVNTEESFQSSRSTESNKKLMKFKGLISQTRENSSGKSYTNIYISTCKAMPLISKQEQKREASRLWSNIKEHKVTFKSVMDELERKINFNKNQLLSLLAKVKTETRSCSTVNNIDSQESQSIVTVRKPESRLSTIGPQHVDKNYYKSYSGKKPICNLSPNPIDWTVKDVEIYLLSKSPSLESILPEFRKHEIDGSSLLLITMDVLRDHMKIKFGPAIKVETIVKNLLQGKL